MDIDNRSDEPNPSFMEQQTAPVEPDSADKSPSHDRLSPPVKLLLAIIIGCVLTYLNLFIGQLVPVPSAGSPLGHIVSILYLGVLLFTLLRAAQAAADLKVSPAFLIASGFVLAIPVLVSILAGVGTALVSQPFAALAGTLDALPYAIRFLTSNLLGLLGMILMGSGFGRLFRHPNTLLAGAGFAIFFDLVVVTMGTVAQLMKSGSDVISLVSVGAGAGGMPVHGIPHHTINFLSTVTIGPADILFIAVFLAAVHTLRLAPRPTFWWMYALLMTALILVETTALPIPALVPMGISVLIANGRFAALTRTEKRDLAIGGVFALFCATLMIAGARHFFPTPPPHYGFSVGKLPKTPNPVVTGMTRGSPAERGGLHLGDMLLTIGGFPADKITDEQFIHARSAPGGLALHLKRAGESKPIDLLLRPDKK